MSPLRRRLHHDEQGIAMVAVLTMLLVLSMLVAVSMRFALNNESSARRNQDWAAALAAADAGLDDYLSRLNRDPAYYANFDASNTGGNDALDGWAPILSAPGGDSQGEFHYDVIVPPGQTVEQAVGDSGSVIVRSTGRVNGVTRTVQTAFRVRGFLEFIYFTDFEIVDPDQTNNYGNECAVHFYAEGGNPSRDSLERSGECQPPIRFVSKDVIDGPMHSNDAILIDGDTTFKGQVTTSWQGTAGVIDEERERCQGPYNTLWRNQFGNRTAYTSNPRFEYEPAEEALCYEEQKTMPPTNAAILDQTTSATGGCIYYGPTYIHLDGDKMRVRSPLSAPSRPVPAGMHRPNPACLGPGGNSANDTGYIDIPDNGVVAVVDNPAVTFGSCNSGTHPLSMPRAGDFTSYDCNVGDVFVHGELDGQLTISAENNITVVWDLTYAGGYENSDDLLGLIADQYIQIYHPVNTSNQNLFVWDTGTNHRPPFIDATDRPTGADKTWQDPEVHAAMLSLNHSFRVQNYRYGQPFNNGELSVRGAIAQKFRGPVGTSYSNGTKASGYDKDYVYDYRLRFLSPPYFIQPVNAQWVQRGWSEVSAPNDLP